MNSSEFWLTLAASIFSALVGGGVIHLTSETMAIVTIIATILGALGYSYCRTLLKSQSLVTAVATLAAPTVAQAVAGAVVAGMQVQPATTADPLQQSATANLDTAISIANIERETGGAAVVFSTPLADTSPTVNLGVDYSKWPTAPLPPITHNE